MRQFLAMVHSLYDLTGVFMMQVLHLKKEVTKCVHFKSADESLTLIPEEQFFKEVIKSHLH